jgi:hypothetical protein
MKKIIILFFISFLIIIFNIKSENKSIDNIVNIKEIYFTKQNEFCDTIQIIELINDTIYKGDKYTVLYGVLCIDEEKNKKGIYILKNDSIIEKIKIPEDNEVMNFELNKIEQIKDGFIISTSANSNYDYLIRNFKFQFIENKFLITNIDGKNTTSYSNGVWIYRPFKIEKPIEVKDFNFEDYFIL